MAASEESLARRNRKPSRLALQLTDAFAALDEWSEVKVVRDEFGHRDRIVAPLRPAGSGPHPYDWSAAA
jgi:hypothetical protein